MCWVFSMFSRKGYKSREKRKSITSNVRFCWFGCDVGFVSYSMCQGGGFNNLSMKEGSLFCFVIMRSTELKCFRLCPYVFGKLSMTTRGAWAWFHNVWTCSAKVLEY